MNIKQPIRKIINKCGFEISRLHKSESVTKDMTPAKIQDNIVLFETALGSFYLPTDAPDDVVINSIKEGKVFEPEIVETAKRFIKKDSIVLDVGANFGQMSILFSKITGENGLVYAFEADDFVFELLKRNIEVNNCKNIVPVFGAVYKESGKEFFFPKQDFKRFSSFGSYGIDPNATEGRQVTSLMIDDFDFTKPVSFMKVDVQGSDLFAMQGAKSTIEKHKMSILFEFEQQFQEEFATTFQDYVDFVSSVDYKFAETVMSVNYLINPK